MFSYKTKEIKKLKIKIPVIRFYFIGIFLFFITYGIVENIIIKRKIKNFIADAEFVYEDKENGLRFYRVSRETSQSSLTYEDDYYYVGKKGDILVKKKATYVEIPVIQEVFSYFIGGHAGIVSEDYKKTIEVCGNEDENKVSYYNNDWFVQGDCIGLRLKDQTIVDGVLENVKDKLGEKYNYTYIFDTGYYCSDLISVSAYEDNKTKLNDFGETTINDLIASKNVEICYYHYKDSNGIKYIYYID